MSNQKSKKVSKISVTSQKKKGGRCSKYSEELNEIAAEIVLKTGKVSDVCKTLNIARSTLSDWQKKFPKFSEAISQARLKRIKIESRDYTNEVAKAIESLSLLIEPYEWTETQTLSKKSENGEEEVQWTKKTTRLKMPDIRAIRKVLGEKDLRHTIIFKKLEQYIPESKGELYRAVFGNLGSGAKVEAFMGIYVLSPFMDMIKIRYMEAMVQKLFDQDMITLDDYMEYTQKLRHEFIIIADRTEQRAMKLLEGKSYQDIIIEFDQLKSFMIETFQEVQNDVNIPREKLCEETVNRLNERKDRLLYAIKTLPAP